MWVLVLREQRSYNVRADLAAHDRVLGDHLAWQCSMWIREGEEVIKE